MLQGQIIVNRCITFQCVNSFLLTHRFQHLFCYSLLSMIFRASIMKLGASATLLCLIVVGSFCTFAGKNWPKMALFHLHMTIKSQILNKYKSLIHFQKALIERNILSHLSPLPLPQKKILFHDPRPPFYSTPPYN